MAAKGEQVDIKELAKAAQMNSDAEASTKIQHTSPTNGPSNSSIESPQVVPGADATSKPTSAGQSTPIAAVTTPAGTGAVPQALLASGKRHYVHMSIHHLADTFA